VLVLVLVLVLVGAVVAGWFSSLGWLTQRTCDISISRNILQHFLHSGMRKSNSTAAASLLPWMGVRRFA